MKMEMVELSSQDALIGVGLTATLTDSDGGVPDLGQIMGQDWELAEDHPRQWTKVATCGAG